MVTILRYDERMTTHFDPSGLRSQIAMAAARMIAEDGADYATAKRKAVKQLLGNGKVRGEVLPDNEEIEEEVRAYQELFQSDSQPQRLLYLRQLAAELMQELASFNPWLIGAVFNGTAGEHSDIYLHLYTDNSKDVAIFLLNKDVQFEVSETFDQRQQSHETYSFMYKREGVHLVVHESDDLRHASHKHTERTDLAGLQVLIAETSTD